MKKDLAYDQMYGYNLKSKQTVKLPQEYDDPKPHEYRKMREILPGEADFNLRFKVDEIENPKGLSVFADKPKYITDKEKVQ